MFKLSLKILFFSFFTLFAFCSKSQTYLFGIVTGGTTPPISSDKKIVCDGNSLTFGANYSAGSDSSYPKKLQVLLPTSLVINDGTNGATIQDMLDQYSANIAPKYTADSTSILVAWEGNNQVYFIGYPIDSAKNKIRRYCEWGRTTGYKVIVCTPVHFGFAGNNPSGHDSAYYNRQIDTINTWLRSSYTDFADKLVDFAADSRLNDYNNTTYRDSDKIHYIGAGYTLVAAAVRTKIDEL